MSPFPEEALCASAMIRSPIGRCPPAARGRIASVRSLSAAGRDEPDRDTYIPTGRRVSCGDAPRETVFEEIIDEHETPGDRARSRPVRRSDRLRDLSVSAVLSPAGCYRGPHRRRVGPALLR